MNDSKSAMETENSEEGGTRNCSDNPPQVNFDVPKVSDLPKAYSKSWKDLDLPVDFLVLTVEDCERLAFFSFLENPFMSYSRDVGYVYFGFMGNGVGKKLKIALMNCSKGSAVPGGSLTVVKDAVRVLRPKAVFSVGACSGLNRGKVKLGDVVVSSKLITLTHQTPASRNIGNLIRHAADGWKAPLENPDAREVRVHCDGEVLSSPEASRDDIMQKYPEAIAFEMEGEGVFAAAHDLKTEWVLIKGIKNYADEKQPSSEEWGVFASVMAASVVANILRDPVVFEEWSHYNQEASPANSFDVKTCQRKLAEHYQKKAKVPTTAWSSVLQVEIEQIYTRLSWVKEEQTPAGSSQKELRHYTEIFTEKTKNGVVAKRILVQGDTGIGKTTFVKKLLLDWSNLEEAQMDEKRKDALRKFDLVVSINLKEVSKCQTFKEVISCSQLFPEDDEESIDDLFSYICKNQDKVLLVFDGYDEYRTGSEAHERYSSRSNSPIYEIFHGNILRDCTVLVTTRSSRADEIRGPADIQAEITGFNMPDREDFMRKMLDSQTEVDGLLDFLWDSNMQDLARVPLLTLFFCLLWKKEKEKLIELTERKAKLYQAIVKHILQHSHRRHSPSKASRPNETDYKEILAEIGKVALAGLLKGDLVFKFGQLPEKVRGEEGVIVGLFQFSEYGPCSEPMEVVSFIHKSIQEYLAAWYITYSCVPEGNLGGIEEHACTLEDCRSLEIVFQFICGLSDKGAVKVLEHLTAVRISDPTLDLPDVETETNVPLFNFTSWRSHSWLQLVYNSFLEVQSKAELLNHFLDCVGGFIEVGSSTLLSEILPNVNVLTKLARNCVFSFSYSPLNLECGIDTGLFKSLEFLNCLQVPVRMTESSEVLTVKDFMRKFLLITLAGCDGCRFHFILCFRNGQFQFYITELVLRCDDHARLFTESNTIAVPSDATSLRSEPSCLKFLSSLPSLRLSGQTVKVLGSVLPNCKHLSRIKVLECDDSIHVCYLLEQVQNPSKCSVKIGVGPLYGRRIHLASAGAVQLASLLPRFKNIIDLHLDLSDCCAAALDTLVTGITHKTLEQLILCGIRLTPAAAAALGRSLPEMSSLQVLGLTGVDGSLLQAEEMENLFGGVNKSLPLNSLSLFDFRMRGCLAPLMKSLRFFPNLIELNLEKLHLDEHDQCGLLESFGLIRNVTRLFVRECEEKYWVSFYYYTSEADPSYSHVPGVKTLKLQGVSLTPAVAAVLGRLLPEMSSLVALELIGVNGSILQTEEMEALFGGFKKEVLLLQLALCNFNARGCLAPLIRGLRFFPNMLELHLEMLNMDEHDLLGLLESFQSIPDLFELNLSGNPLGRAVISIVPHVINLKKLQYLSINQTTHSEEHLDYVRDAVEQALPELKWRNDQETDV